MAVSHSSSSIGYRGPAQLYLNIVEGRNLKAVSENGSSDPMVEVNLGSTATVSLKTPVRYNTLHPQFHTEFLFTMKDTKGTLLFRLWDYVRLLSNVPLGRTILDLATLVPRQLHDIWMPVTDGGELRILVKLSPLSTVGVSKNMRLPCARVLVENNVYYPGEVVRGAILYNVDDTSQNTTFHFRALGDCRTSWTESYGDTHVVFDGRIIFFDSVTALLTTPKNMSNGSSHFWPFEFVIPLHCPPSTSIDRNIIQYTLSASIDMPNRSSITDTVVILVKPTPLPRPFLNYNITVKDEARFPSTTSLPVEVTLMVPQFACAGDTIDIEFTIRNRSPNAVKRVTLELDQTIMLTGQSVRLQSKEGTSVKKHVFSSMILARHPNVPKKFVVAPGETLSDFKLKVLLPPNLLPSIAGSNSPNFQIFHSFSLHVVVEAKYLTDGTNSTHCPIFISETPLRTPLVSQHAIDAQNKGGPPKSHRNPASGVPTHSDQVCIAAPPNDYMKYLPPIGSVATQSGKGPWHSVVPSAAEFASFQLLKLRSGPIALDPHTSKYVPGDKFGRFGAAIVDKDQKFNFIKELFKDYSVVQPPISSSSYDPTTLFLSQIATSLPAPQMTTVQTSVAPPPPPQVVLQAIASSSTGSIPTNFYPLPAMPSSMLSSPQQALLSQPSTNQAPPVASSSSISANFYPVPAWPSGLPPNTQPPQQPGSQPPQTQTASAVPANFYPVPTYPATSSSNSRPMLQAFPPQTTQQVTLQMQQQLLAQSSTLNSAPIQSSSPYLAASSSSTSDPSRTQPNKPISNTLSNDEFLNSFVQMAEDSAALDNAVIDSTPDPSLLMAELPSFIGLDEEDESAQRSAPYMDPALAPYGPTMVDAAEEDISYELGAGQGPLSYTYEE